MAEIVTIIILLFPYVYIWIKEYEAFKDKKVKQRLLLQATKTKCHTYTEENVVVIALFPGTAITQKDEIFYCQPVEILTDGKYCSNSCLQKYGDECLLFRNQGDPSGCLISEDDKCYRCSKCLELGEVSEEKPH